MPLWVKTVCNFYPYARQQTFFIFIGSRLKWVAYVMEAFLKVGREKNCFFKVSSIINFRY